MRMRRALVSVFVALSLVAGAPAVAWADDRVELPDYVGEPFDLANKALKALDLKVKTSSGGRLVIVKRNWIVTAQRPVAGSQVEAGDKITLTVVKKSELVSETQAYTTCRALAKTDPELDYGVRFPFGEYVAAHSELKWSIDIDAWATTSTGGEVAIRVYCEIAGTKKKPKVIEYEITGR